MSNPAVFNVLKGEFQTYEEYFGKEEEHKMTKYKIFAGLGGGFGGENFIRIAEFLTEDEADKYAYQEAIEQYESYGGYHGLYTEESMKESLIENGDYTEEELDADPEIVENAYKEDIENWIEWHAEECTGDCFNCDEESQCSQQDECGNECIPQDGDCKECDSRKNCKWNKSPLSD